MCQSCNANSERGDEPHISPSELKAGLGAFDVEAMIAEADAKKNRRAEKMPTEREALAVMFEAYLRLKELGWREAMYAPRDNRPLELIEAGSTGIHNGHCRECLSSDFPMKWFWICDDDMWPSSPILFRESPNVERNRPAGGLPPEGQVDGRVGRRGQED